MAARLKQQEIASLGSAYKDFLRAEAREATSLINDNIKVAPTILLLLEELEIRKVGLLPRLWMEKISLIEDGII